MREAFTMSLAAVVFLVLGCWSSTNLKPVSAQADVTTDLLPGQTRACRGRTETFSCTGPLPLISVYAPPFLVQGSATYDTSQMPGQTGFVDGPFVVTLRSTDPLVAQLTIDVNNTSFETLEIFCENSLLNGASLTQDTVFYNRSDSEILPPTDCESTPKDGDYYLGVLEASWTAPTGNFDIDCYEVKVMADNVVTMMFNTTSTLIEATFPGTVGSNACVNITAISMCGNRSPEVSTNTVKPKLSPSVIAVTIFMVLFLVMLGLVFAVMLIVLYKKKK